MGVWALFAPDLCTKCGGGGGYPSSGTIGELPEEGVLNVMNSIRVIRGVLDAGGEWRVLSLKLLVRWTRNGDGLRFLGLLLSLVAER